MKSILLLIIVLSERLWNTECVQCFQRVDQSGRCEQQLGEVELDDCCQNTNYGYHDDQGVCHYCGPLVVTEWSPWGRCSVLCGEGGRHRSRKCLGLPKSKSDCQKHFQTEPCNSTTCCSAVQWSSWSSWLPCSVSCGGGGGVQQRQRACPSQEAGCRDTCVGERSQSQPCTVDQPCPVHGRWGQWGAWTPCSASCVTGSDDDVYGVVYPTRSRYRLCDSPAPSSDTVPPGNNCPGENYETDSCSYLPNCPVDGGWGPYGAPGPCSVSCGEGLQLSVRQCDTPTPKYGGKPCAGTSTETRRCNTPCPVHGGWTGWSSWGECSTSCLPEGRASSRTRRRSCTNPAPSFSGSPCMGDESETSHCTHLPHCTVDGGWGSWSLFTSCSVTCGVGLQLSVRDCNNPASNNGGMPCQGAGNRTIICKTAVHCPVDGVWSSWTPWGPCVFGSRDIKCKTIGGTQDRERQCDHRDHGGRHCPVPEGMDNAQLETRGCYDVTGCPLKGSWAGWGEWSPCKPSCGSGRSGRVRKRICNPDLSAYRPTIGRQKLKAHFHGDPNTDCGDLADGEEEYERQRCIIPACPP